MKSLEQWDEAVIELLAEDDSTELKGAALLDLSNPHAKESAIKEELSKQLSAFANSGGGRIVYGVEKDKKLTGIPIIARGRQTTKEWLEDLIPTLTEPEIHAFRVLELASENFPTPASDRRIFVVIVPDRPQCSAPSEGL
jgi:hypothetical protein